MELTHLVLMGLNGLKKDVFVAFYQRQVAFKELFYDLQNWLDF
jgi:hypothetical protein